MASKKIQSKTTSPVYYSKGQKSSKFRWWTASWGVHRGLGLPIHGFPVKMFVLVHFTAKSFGKVELNLASTPSLECLRRKLLEESLIWLSKCPGRGKALFETSFQLFHGGFSGKCEHSRNLIHCRESCLFINSKKSSQKQLLQQSLLVKLNQIQRKLLEESLI